MDITEMYEDNNKNFSFFASEYQLPPVVNVCQTYCATTVWLDWNFLHSQSFCSSKVLDGRSVNQHCCCTCRLSPSIVLKYPPKYPHWKKCELNSNICL